MIRSAEIKSKYHQLSFRIMIRNSSGFLQKKFELNFKVNAVFAVTAMVTYLLKMHISGAKRKLVFWGRLVPISLVSMYLWHDLSHLLLLLLLLLLLQVKPVKVIYNYFTLYKASSLNLKIIWSKRVRFFVFLRCRIFIRRSHVSRLSAIVRSDSICF